MSYQHSRLCAIAPRVSPGGCLVWDCRLPLASKHPRTKGQSLASGTFNGKIAVVFLRNVRMISPLPANQNLTRCNIWIYVVQTKHAIIVSQILTWNIVKHRETQHGTPKQSKRAAGWFSPGRFPGIHSRLSGTSAFAIALHISLSFHDAIASNSRVRPGLLWDVLKSKNLEAYCTHSPIYIYMWQSPFTSHLMTSYYYKDYEVIYFLREISWNCILPKFDPTCFSFRGASVLSERSRWYIYISVKRRTSSQSSTHGHPTLLSHQSPCVPLTTMAFIHGNIPP